MKSHCIIFQFVVSLFQNKKLRNMLTYSSYMVFLMINKNLKYFLVSVSNTVISVDIAT